MSTMSDLRAGEELAEKNGREEELNEYGKTEPDDFLVRTDFRDSQYYVNRELSWIGFNERVLEEGEDPTNPLLERLKFLAIFSSNMLILNKNLA